MKTLKEILFGLIKKDANTELEGIATEDAALQSCETKEETENKEELLQYPAVYHFATKGSQWESAAHSQENAIKHILDHLGNNVSMNGFLGVERTGESPIKYVVRGTAKLTTLSHAILLKKTLENGYELQSSVVIPQKAEGTYIVDKLTSEKDLAVAKATTISQEKDQLALKYAVALKTLEILDDKITKLNTTPKAIYQFETKPMTVQEANARVANINCILESYAANVAAKNFAAYPTRKTQVEMKDLLDSKNLLVDPEEFIAGVISITGEEYAKQVRNTIEAIIPMQQSALTYQGKSLVDKVATDTTATKTE